MEPKKRKRQDAIDSHKTDLFLKKHVGLIHCENKLTLIQRKICNILLFNALDTINEEDIHEISLRQLCSLVGYNSHDSQLIKASIKTLISVVMEWNLLEDNKFLNADEVPEDAITWNASSLLAGASIKKGVIHYSYSPQIKSVISSLEIYGRINLFVQAKFNSSYSLVLYENCARFKSIKQTSWFSLELFRSLMGVSETKYRSFKEFNRNVIQVSVKEINEKADICIEPQFKKSGRQIVAIKFVISENKNYQPSFRKASRLPIVESIPKQQALLKDRMITEFDLSELQAREIIVKYPADYIVEKMQLVKTKRNVDHSGAYFIAALNKDFKIKKAKEIKIMENSYLREAKAASEIGPLKNKYMSYKLKIYTQFIQQQAETIQQIIKDKFESFIKPKKEIVRFYKKSGLASPFVMTDFLRFIDLFFPEIIGNYLSFDDYITSDES